MKKILVAAALALAASTSAMAAGLTGESFTYQYYYPDLSSAYSGAGNGSYVVGSGVEVSNLVEGVGTLDVTDSQIVIDFTTGSQFSNGSFNGFLLSGLGFSSVTVDASSTLSGFTLTTSGDDIWVNWQGVAFSSGDTLVLDVTSSVPEASNVALMLAGLGLVGVAARRRRAA